MNLIFQGMLHRQGLGFKKCPGLGSATGWSPCTYTKSIKQSTIGL